MNKHLISSLLLFLSLTAQAAPSTSGKNISALPARDFSLRAMALSESKMIDEKAYKKTIQASEAQQANVSSFLKLQDPTPELRDRPWLYTFTFKLQNLQPSGTGKIAGSTFDLKNYGAGVMPSLEFGFLFGTIENRQLSWESGLSAHLGLMAQSLDLIAPNGYLFKNTRLNTTLVSVLWSHRMKPSFAPKFSFLLNPEIGFVNYTQTSMESSLANFVQQNNFWGLGSGVEYSFSRKWALLAQYVYREANAKDMKISGLQKFNIEIGTQITW